MYVTLHVAPPIFYQDQKNLFKHVQRDIVLRYVPFFMKFVRICKNAYIPPSSHA